MHVDVLQLKCNDANHSDSLCTLTLLGVCISHSEKTCLAEIAVQLLDGMPTISKPARQGCAHLTWSGRWQFDDLQGLGRSCMYCGDGINDLIALSAADVGVSIGASDASAAATISTKDCSVAGNART